MERNRNRWTAVIFWMLVIPGLLLLLYPTVSNWWNQRHQSYALAQYQTSVSRLDQKEQEKLFREAVEYNQTLLEKENRFGDTQEGYDELFCIEGNGIMGSIEIPKIGVVLPIYHGTEEASLQKGVGHLEGSSLPVGGKSTHCVLVGHRGLPSARLFTDLDQLVIGDVFYIETLNERRTYEVDQILVVEPDQLDVLEIREGEEECTLVTCTPYGINTHRLCVRGHRCKDRVETKEETAKWNWIFWLVLVSLLKGILILIFIRRKPHTKWKRHGKWKPHGK